MNHTLLLYKPIGYSPLDTINAYIATHPEYHDQKLGYAGRLDPMAEGLLLILVGDENKSRQKYLGMDKKYSVTLLCGISTDSHDVLGKRLDIDLEVGCDKNQLNSVMQNFTGKIIQKYPLFSSKTHNGKPLFYWGREGGLDDRELPTDEREIYNLELESVYTRPLNEVADEAMQKIESLRGGEFRQEEIVAEWAALKNESDNEDVFLVDITVSCSSGTYMRRLAHDIGTSMDVPMLAFSIIRTQIGDLSLENAEMLA